MKSERASLRIPAGSITGPKRRAARKSTAVRFAVRSRLELTAGARSGGLINRRTIDG